MTLSPISVVIPSQDRGELLVHTIEACRRQAGGVELERRRQRAAIVRDPRKVSLLSAEELLRAVDTLVGDPLRRSHEIDSARAQPHIAATRRADQ